MRQQGCESSLLQDIISLAAVTVQMTHGSHGDAAGETVYQPRAPVALTADPGLVPSTHIM